jgi:hypothetical protein
MILNEKEIASNNANRRATWLELFYDLVFVVVIFQLAHYLDENFTLNGFLGFLALFVPVWWSWTGAVFYATRFDTDDLGHRILVLLQMVGAAFLAVYVSDAFGDGSVGFALSYAAIRIFLVLEYVRTGTTIDVCNELWQSLQSSFDLAPIIICSPITCEFLNRGKLYALAPIWRCTSLTEVWLRDRFLFGPPCRIYPPAQFGKFGIFT